MPLSGGLRRCRIFSGCNRCCTLHIVYNGLWIDVDGGKSLAWTCINVFQSVPVERGLYGFAQACWRRARHPMPCNCFGVLGLALQSCWRGSLECVGFDSRGLLFALLCIAAIAAVCKTATFDTPVVRVHHGALGLMGVAAHGTDGIARISPLEHVGDKRLPALIRWLMTEGEARPNGCIDVSRSLPLVVKPIPPCRTSFRLGR